MAELALTQSPEQDRLFTLDGFGSVVPGGIFGGQAVTIVDTAGGRYEGRPSGLGALRYEIEDRAGTVIGRFRRQYVRGGGTIRWNGEEFVLRRRGLSTVNYELRRGGLSVARFRVTGFPTQPVEVETSSAGLFAAPLLFAAFQVWRFDHGSGGSGGGSGGCGGGCGGGGS